MKYRDSKTLRENRAYNPVTGLHHSCHMARNRRVRRKSGGYIYVD